MRNETLERLGPEVIQDSSLALFPRLVQRTGSALSAGAILHDAAGEAERPFNHLNRFPKRHLARRPRQPGDATAALLALDQISVGELGQLVIDWDMLVDRLEVQTPADSLRAGYRKGKGA